MNVMKELIPIGELYKSGDFSGGLKRLKEIWAQIPEPKTSTSNAYNIIEYGVAFALKKGDLDIAWEWAGYAPGFSEKRQDRGETEFLVGKVAFERGEKEIAKQKFLIANKKSKGRIFIDEDPKYKALIK